MSMKFDSIQNKSIEDRLRSLAGRTGGYFRLPQCKGIGITPMQVYWLVRCGRVIRDAPGIFRLSDAVEDELYALSLRFPKLVFSHATALYLQGFGDRPPFTPDVTVPRGFHSATLSKTCLVRQCEMSLQRKGIVTVRTHEGNPVPVYCLERTLCELLHAPRNFDKQIFLPALRRFAHSPQSDRLRLFEFARLFKVEEKMILYMEVT